MYQLVAPETKKPDKIKDLKKKNSSHIAGGPSKGTKEEI
jgi:hypothetical protein